VSLYNLTKLKQSLTSAVDISPTVNNINDVTAKLQGIIDEIPDTRPEYKNAILTLIKDYEQILLQIDRTIQSVETQVGSIDSRILLKTRELFANNYELEERIGSVEQVRNNRRLEVTADLEAIVRQKIARYTDWRYPALEIGCRDGEWTQHLVASDPLYITDRHTEFLNSTNDRFPPVYQARLRKYQLIDHNLSALPANQFAFVFSWGFFNYVSFDTVTQMLKQLHTLMRPGGVFMFSYNDGDTPAGAGMAEKFSQTYLPKSLLVPLCLSLGFELLHDESYGSNISWLEIKKPGTLKTIKAHQVLGSIEKREI
jgi:hypothetical protein